MDKNIEGNEISQLAQKSLNHIETIEKKQHFYRVYFHYANGKVKLIDESSTKPILARYVSKIY